MSALNQKQFTENAAPLDIDFPKVLDFLITEPARYKVLYGGRGAGKSEGVSIALIILSSQKKLRILCLRELQTSIDESVKSTIESNISSMGLDNEFLVLDKRIVSKRTGSEFIFSGLRYNINKIKSMSRIDIAWVEEANNVSRTSWDKLGPTIRGRAKDDPRGMGGPFGLGPEIWVSFNPELEEDETYKRFVLHRDKFTPDYITDDETGERIRYAIVKKVNWTDNKWFPPDLRREMLVMKAADETRWLEVWQGHTKQVLEGAIYADEIRKATLDKRIGKVPYDPSRPVHTFWDLGHSDKTAIWFIQTIGVEFNVIDYYEDNLKKMPFYIKVLQEKGYAYGVHNLPHDGDAETISNRTPKKQLTDAGHKVRIIKRPAKKFLGIDAARTVFDLCNFDEVNTADGLQCLRRYCYEVDEESGLRKKEPKHDENSHGADAWQTFALSLKSETDTKKKAPQGPTKNNVVPMRGNTGWMG